MRLVIFDVDGTLVDSADLIVAAQGLAFAEHGLPAPGRERALSVVGLSLPEAFAALVGPDGPVDGLAESYRGAFGRLRADPARAEPAFPGMLDLVADLARRDDVRLGIATGKSRRGVAHLVARFGWDGLFATIQTADDAPSKPDPGMLHRAMAETGIPAADAVMIGDSTYDMLMARGAHVGALGVGWGYHRPEALRRAGAEAVAEDVPDLARRLAARWRTAA